MDRAAGRTRQRRRAAGRGFPAAAARVACGAERRSSEVKDFSLPLVRADGVAYQSAVVAVEGNAELDINVKTEARTVDVGELVAAQYPVGKRLLGVYESVGPPQPVQVDVNRRPGYGLPPAIVQRAELVTVLSAEGVSQTAARYQLRTKAAFLEVRLPAQSELWSAYLDGQPVAPQRDGDRLLLDLPASVQNAIRDLQVIYETPRDLGGAAESGGHRGPDAVAPQRPRCASGRSADGRRDVETPAARRPSPGAVQRYGVHAGAAAAAFADVECARRPVLRGGRRPEHPGCAGERAADADQQLTEEHRPRTFRNSTTRTRRSHGWSSTGERAGGRRTMDRPSRWRNLA